MRKVNENKIKERIRDEDVLKAYNRYQTYLRELDIYDKYKQENMSKKDILELYEEAGIEEKDVLKRFQTLISEINSVKKKNPNIDLRDIRTQTGRQAVSDIIYETQDDKDFKPSDLSDVAVIENLSLYAAVRDVNERLKLKEVALVHYDIGEEEFDRAQATVTEYKKSGAIDKFNAFKDSSSIVHYAAATLEETPVNVYEAFKRLGLEKGEFTPKREKVVEAYRISQLVIDNIMRDPKLTLEQKQAKVKELQQAEINKKQELANESNTKKGGKVYKVIVEDNEPER